MPRTRVFMDTSVIIGAFRVCGGDSHFWQGICSHFCIETVQACVAETQQGSPAAKGYTAVPPEELEALAARWDVDADMVETFRDQCRPHRIQRGEEQLLAHLYCKEAIASDTPGIRHLPPNVLIAATDKDALKAMRRLGWLEDHAVSLQWLVERADMMFPLPGQLDTNGQQYTEARLQGRKAPWGVGEWLPPWPLQPSYG